jgi:hypothetical protein
MLSYHYVRENLWERSIWRIMNWGALLGGNGVAPPFVWHTRCG